MDDLVPITGAQAYGLLIVTRAWIKSQLGYAENVPWSLPPLPPLAEAENRA